MKRVTFFKLPLAGFVVGLFAMLVTVGMSSSAYAHVTVKPAEVVTAGYQTFTVNVPNEKEIPTVSVKVVIPEAVAHITPTQKAGWNIAIDSEGQGEEARVTSITWDGGAISSGLRDEFTFSAQVPEKATSLEWKAYQTYSDGTVVSWDQKSEGGHGESENAGPLSVTEVLDESAQDAGLQAAEKAAADARSLAVTALYVAVAGVAMGLIGVYVGTRKK